METLAPGRTPEQLAESAAGSPAKRLIMVVGYDARQGCLEGGLDRRGAELRRGEVPEGTANSPRRLRTGGHDHGADPCSFPAHA